MTKQRVAELQRTVNHVEAQLHSGRISTDEAVTVLREIADEIDRDIHARLLWWLVAVAADALTIAFVFERSYALAAVAAGAFVYCLYRFSSWNQLL